MATDAVGNVLYAPGTGSKAFTTDLELLSSTVGWRQVGVTLKVGQGVLPVGTPLKLDSATGTYVPTANDGTAAEGFLRLQTDTGVSGEIPKLGNLVTKGSLKYSVIKAALVFLGATSTSSSPALSTGAINALNGRIDSYRDEFDF